LYRMTRFLVVERMVNRTNRKDVEDFQALSAKAAAGKLKTPGKKKLVRLQVRLQREGVIIAATRDHLRSAARDLYASFPWWKKLHLRMRYRRRVIYVWIVNQWKRLQLWWITK